MRQSRVVSSTAWLAGILLALGCRKDSSSDGGAVNQPTPIWRIDFRSVGPIRINMTVAEASAALGERLNVPPPDESLCRWSSVRSSKTPPGVSFTVSEDTIVRIDVDSTGVPTVDGLQVGSPIDDMLQKYDTLIERDISLDGDPVFTLASREPERGFLIIYLTDGARVTRIVSGRRMAAQVQECA